MDNRIERIRAKLLERMRINLRAENTDLIKLETLPYEKIAEFEKEHRIKLPEEIVQFYTEISNGAVLFPDEDICNLVPFEKWYFSPEMIQRDFIVENEMTFDDYEAIGDRDYSFEDFGDIAVMDLGCDMSYRIIVKGKHCGEMIAVHEMWLEFTAKDFLDWLENCLDGNDENILSF